MLLTRGRVIKRSGEPSPEDAAWTPRAPSPSSPRRTPAAVAAAHERARAIVEDAEAQARRIVEDARTTAHDVAEAHAARAREAEHARLGAAFLALRAEDASRSVRDLDRAIDIATLLAERMIGATLDLQPDVVLALARESLSRTRGARRVRLTAHPLDAAAVRAHTADLVPAADDLEILEDPSLSRGSLLLHTDLGAIDARLPVQLDRLAAAIRDVLQRT